MSADVRDVILAVSEAIELAFSDFQSNLSLQKVTVELLTEITRGASGSHEYKLLDTFKLGGKVDLSKVDVSTLKLELTPRKFMGLKLEERPNLNVVVEEAVEGIKSAIEALATDYTFGYQLTTATIDLKFTVKKEAKVDILVVGFSGAEVLTHHLILEVEEPLIPPGAVKLGEF